MGNWNSHLFLMWSCSAWRAFLRLLVTVRILPRVLASSLTLPGADFAPLHQRKLEWFFWKRWDWCFVWLRRGVLLHWVRRSDEFYSKWIVASVSRLDASEFEWCEWHTIPVNAKALISEINDAKNMFGSKFGYSLLFSPSPKQLCAGIKSQRNLKKSASWTLPVVSYPVT